MSGANGFRDDMTLQEARDLLRSLARSGHDCPVCRRLVKVYRRGLNAGMAASLIRLYHAGAEHQFVEISKLIGYGNEVTRLHLWGLVEAEDERRPDGGRRGCWRMTPQGVQFVLGQLTVPSHVLVYDARRLRFDGEEITIRQALGRRFDYAELMAA